MPFQALRFLRDDLKNRRIVTMRKILLLISVSLFFAAAGFAQGTSTSTTATTAAAGDTSARAPIFRPTKDQIKQVQTMLKEKKLYDGEALGTYNDETRTGIKGFQKDNGLKQTGTLNRATLEKMNIALTDSQKSIPVSPNSFDNGATPAKTARSGTVAHTSTATSDASKTKTIFRANKDQIMAAQKMLKDKSMYAGDTNGTLDEGTRGGLKKYQEANGVKVTGTLNAATLEKMGIALTDKQKADTTPK